ncbi:hypothetical protein DT075_09200 [Bacillus licheniformis]|nr:hypothetical protein DT075_09200 [Bacillus licheniformis]
MLQQSGLLVYEHLSPSDIQSGFHIPDHLHFIPLDFAKSFSYQELADKGFHFNKKTFFSFLGVSYYLTKEETEKLLGELMADLPSGPTPLARAAYCERVLHHEIRLGTEQYVILGAGLDTFCFRNLELKDKIDIFEIDHPATQKLKKEKLDKGAYHSQYDEPKIFDDNLAKSLISQQEFADIKNSFIQGIQFFNKAIAEKYEGDDEEILRWITQVQLSSRSLIKIKKSNFLTKKFIYAIIY